MVTGVFELPADLQLDASATSSEWFIAGIENWMVYEVFRVITARRDDERARRLSPIVIHGPSGSGKSLLARLLADLWSQRGLPTQVVPAADWVRAGGRRQPRTDRTPLTASEARSTSRFILDDMHQLVRSESAQRRLAGYLDALTATGGIAVLTTQIAPTSRLPLQEAVLSRLRAGTSIQLSFPESLSRRAMIQKLARELGWIFDHDALEAVDAYLPADPRMLGGRLRQLLPHRPLREQPLTLHDIRMRCGANHASSNIAPEQIIDAVSRQLRVSARMMCSQSRRKNVVEARSIAIYLIRKMTTLPLKAIGALFSDRDHATILHAVQKIEQSLPQDMRLGRMVREIQLLLQTGIHDPESPSP